jgi:alpha-glucoside transport system substrate-binding protein
MSSIILLPRPTRFIKIKRVIAGLALMIAASTTLSACGPALPSGDGTVTIYGPYFGAEAEAFQAELDAFSASSGVRAIYSPIADMGGQVQTDISNSTLPDIAIWDNPRTLLTYQQQMIPLEQIVDLAAIRSTLVPGWDQVAKIDDKTFGLPTSSNIKTGVKSLVFYNPQEFDRLGYKVPTTDQELTSLMEKIKSDRSGYPWCAGIESGGATGWVITDWIENYLLSQKGAESYNQWTKGALKFDSPEVEMAAGKVSQQLLSPGNVAGGGKAMVRENFGNTAGLFTSGGKNSGQCFLMRQGLFITDFFPDDIKAEISRGDYSRANAFALPAADGGKRAVVGDGYLASAFSQDSDASKVLNFILSDKFGKTMVKTTNFLSPHKSFAVDQYRDRLGQVAAATLMNAEVFGFDASTAMPTAVSNQFWISATKWVDESIVWAKVAQEIDGSFNR